MKCPLCRWLHKLRLLRCRIWGHRWGEGYQVAGIRHHSLHYTCLRCGQYKFEVQEF